MLDLIVQPLAGTFSSSADRIADAEPPHRKKKGTARSFSRLWQELSHFRT
jgi:hypothetical protein